jgi:class 3 adenylate cyclase
VAGGDLSQALPVRSSDELGRLTGAFNQMLEGLRQRDFIRSAFGRYVSPEVARELLESPDGLRFGGEKRVVTVLMSDLRGYTRFAEQGDPAHVMDVLNEYLARMTEVVIRHGGTVNEFIGDAVFAVFGAPIAHADHAIRAVKTALDMRNGVAELNERRVGAGKIPIGIGIGLSLGEVVAGTVGTEDRMEYTVIGDSVNLAARLVDNARPAGRILISQATYERVKDLVQVKDLGPLKVKGKEDEVEVYEVLSLVVPA